jgi:hypothetical protein
VRVPVTDRAGPIRCNKHKKEGMFDVKGHRCEVKGCSRRPIFTPPGTRKPRRCPDHKLDGMIEASKVNSLV